MTKKRDLLLLIVAYHPSMPEVDRLLSCLIQLPTNIGYAVVVNDHIPGEPIDKLFIKSDYVLCNQENLGYGMAVNKLVSLVPYKPNLIGVLNTDLSWSKGSFEKIIDWLNFNQDVSLIVPQILNSDGQIQKLCKRNPTILGMLSRRFIPSRLKPNWLKRYDRWYTMSDQDYSNIFESQYLSGCCMLIRTSMFLDVGGFDERYFLYLEDADITRMMSTKGRCLYYPFASVTHSWGRGNYKSFKLMIVNIVSAYKYFRKWGISIW